MGFFDNIFSKRKKEEQAIVYSDTGNIEDLVNSLIQVILRIW